MLGPFALQRVANEREFNLIGLFDRGYSEVTGAAEQRGCFGLGLPTTIELLLSRQRLRLRGY